jgi:hypothetical protein
MKETSTLNMLDQYLPFCVVTQSHERLNTKGLPPGYFIYDMSSHDECLHSTEGQHVPAIFRVE